MIKSIENWPGSTCKNPTPLALQHTETVGPNARPNRRQGQGGAGLRGPRPGRHHAHLRARRAVRGRDDQGPQSPAFPRPAPLPPREQAHSSLDRVGVQEICALFAAQLQGLADTQNQMYAQYYYLLERLSMVSPPLPSPRRVHARQPPPRSRRLSHHTSGLTQQLRRRRRIASPCCSTSTTRTTSCLRPCSTWSGECSRILRSRPPSDRDPRPGQEDDRACRSAQRYDQVLPRACRSPQRCGALQRDREPTACLLPKL